MLAAALLLSLLAWHAPAPALAQSNQPAQAWRIAAGPLDAALNRLAMQAQLTISYPPALVAGKTTQGLAGEHTPTEALRRLLAGTGLTWDVVDDSTFALRPAPDSGPAAPRTSEPRSAAPPAEPDVTDLQGIVVTGTNIRGLQDIPAPVTTITREDASAAGYTKVEEIFRSLPQNLAEVTSDGGFGIGAGTISAANTDAAASVSLRGLGPESTLVLFAGKRSARLIDGRAVDISAIPLAALDRVEVVTGGRSAIYGSDAVAGVVSFVPRYDFEGAESQVSYGFAEAGGERWEASQVAGGQWSRGGFVAAYDYQKDSPLDVVDTGVVRSPAPSGLVLRSLWIQPEKEQHSAFLSGRVQPTDNFEAYATGLYTTSDNRRRLAYGGIATDDRLTRNGADQYQAIAGARLWFGEWQAHVSGNVSGAEAEQKVFRPTGLVQHFAAETRLHGASAVFDGPLPEIAGVRPRMALGVEWRSESYAGRNLIANRTTGDIEREVHSAFAELLVPFDAGTWSADLSLAGRYDDYTDFGDTFNPQAGIVVRAGKLSLKANYSRAFRAPDLYTLDLDNGVALQNRTDPSVEAGRSPTLIWSGGNAALVPETADTWTLGFDYQFTPRVRLSASYFNITYKDRIGRPARGADSDLVLVNEDRFPGLVVRSPDPDLVAAILASRSSTNISNTTGRPFNPATQDILTVFPDLVLFDDRFNNIGTDRLDGIDLDLSANVAFGAADLRFSLNATKLFAFDRQLTAVSPAFTQLNENGKPVDFKLRGGVGLTRGPFSADLFVNYVTDYEDALAVPRRRIDDWTTFDLTLRLSSDPWAQGAILRGIEASLSFRNLFDAGPPLFVNSTLYGLGYDTVNANATGRYIALNLTKRW